MWRLLILLILFSESVLGREIIISQDSDPVKVTTQAGVAIDKSSNFTIDEIEKVKFNYDYQSINFGYTDSTIWLKLNIKNLLDNPDLIININFPPLDKIELFQKSENGWVITKLGDHQKFHQRLLNIPSFAFPIIIKKKSSKIVYLRIQSTSTLSIPTKIFSPNEFNYYLFTHYIIFGIFYGISLGLLLYNLLIYISIRKRTNFLYCLVIISNIFLSLSWDGIIFSFIPDSVYFQQRYNSLALCCCIFTLTLFSKNFLRTAENTPIINIHLNIIASSSVIILILTLSPLAQELFIPVTVLGTLMIPVLLTAGIVRIGQKYIPAKIYLLATGSFLLAVGITTLGTLNIIPLKVMVTYIYKTGVATELILLSLGIASQIKALKLSKQAAVEKVRIIEKEKVESENLALLKSNNLKDAFLSTISHELRTPMNGVKGALGLLENEHNEIHKNELISTINHSSDTMIKLIDRILLFTELKAGRSKNNAISFSIKELIQNEEHNWREQCKVKSVKFETRVNIERAIVTDKLKINGILTEIVENAIKFSNSGKVSISADLTDSNLLIISVCDQGKGIPIELSAELTGFFRQEDEEFNREYGGLGLGLSIASELVKLLAGQLSIRVSEEFSTCIIIEIPVNSAELTREKSSKKEPLMTSYPLKVLIIEDNKINQMVLDKIIKKLGHHTSLADDGDEGYQAAKSQPFDLILMDCQMPNIDGFECTHLIRNTDNINRDTLIIAVTANASESDKEHCLKSGMNDYRKKPIDPSIIKELLADYFVQAN